MESKKWVNTIDALTPAKETIDEVVVNLDVDESLGQYMDDEFEELLYLVKSKIENLMLQDKRLGLHMLTQSKVKENVEADQVRTNDEVKTLVKLLKVQARMVVGEHHKTLENALAELEGHLEIQK